MRTVFDKITGMHLGVTGLGPSEPGYPWPGQIDVEGFWNEEYKYDLATQEVVIDPAFSLPPKSAADVTLKELITQMIVDGTMSQQKISDIKDGR